VTTEKGRSICRLTCHTAPSIIYRALTAAYAFTHRPLVLGELLSGSNGTQLMAALRFLYLIDVNGKPMEILKRLVEAKGESRSRILQEIADDSFGFVLKSSLDLESATYSQLVEVFITPSNSLMTSAGNVSNSLLPWPMMPD